MKFLCVSILLLSLIACYVLCLDYDSFNFHHGHSHGPGGHSHGGHSHGPHLPGPGAPPSQRYAPPAMPPPPPRPPVAAPVKQPVPAPVKPPVAAPVKQPVVAPAKQPVKVPPPPQAQKIKGPGQIKFKVVTPTNKQQETPKRYTAKPETAPGIADGAPVGRTCQNNIPTNLLYKYGPDRLIYVSWRDARYNGGDRAESWNGARTFCRRHCMDLVSLNEGNLNQYLSSAVKDGDVYGMWTSGRFCPGKNCTANSENLVSHWKWLSDWRDDAPVEDNWSKYGGMGRRQPDNLLETLDYGQREECLALLNNWYEDGVSWHDFGCTDKLPFACEGVEKRQQQRKKQVYPMRHQVSPVKRPYQRPPVRH